MNKLALDVRNVTERLIANPRLKLVGLGEIHGPDNPLDDLCLQLLNTLPAGFFSGVVLEQWGNTQILAEEFSANEIELAEFAYQFNFPTRFFLPKFTPIRHKSAEFFLFLNALRQQAIPIFFIDEFSRRDFKFCVGRRDHTMFANFSDIENQRGGRYLFHGGYGHLYRRSHSRVICPSFAEFVESRFGPGSVFSILQVTPTRVTCANTGLNKEPFQQLEENRLVLMREFLKGNVKSVHQRITPGKEGQRSLVTNPDFNGKVSNIEFDCWDAAFYSHDWCRPQEFEDFGALRNNLKDRRLARPQPEIA